MEEGRELPVGWELVPLLDLGELIRGVTYTKNDASDSPFSGSVPVLRANNIQDRHFELDGLVHVPSDLVSPAQIITKGDVVIATSSGSIAVVGKAAQAQEDLGAGFGAFCGLIRPSTEISLDYYGHFFSTEYYRSNVSAMARGVNINNLKKSHFESLSFPLAPLNEQRRIAAKLDTTLAAVDACRQRLDGLEVLLKRFRQAVLAAATSGVLTREWREERGMEKDWLGTCLSDIADIQGGLTKDSKKQDLLDPELPYLRVANVQRGYLDLREMAFIRVPRKRLDALLLQDGDILFNEGGDRDKVGRGWIWEAQITECVFQNHVFRARLLNEGNQPKYVSWWANTCGASHFLGQGKQTTNLASISKTTLGLLPIQLPCAAEQEEIVRRVETFFTLADQLEARLTTARKIVDRLTPALLAKAFRGELVPQDPNDEPASVLLERIRAYRQVDTASGKPTRPRRRNAQTSITKPTALTYMLTRNNVQANHLSAILKECGPLSAEALWSASQLEIDDFYAQLRDEEDHGFLRENCGDSPNSPRLLEPTA